MKRKSVFFLLSAMLCLSSCAEETISDSTDRPFVENAVELCKSYIGMAPEDASRKMQQDWYSTASCDEEVVSCYPPLEIIRAYSENGKIYKVKYWRTLTDQDSEKAGKIILKVSDDVAKFYDEDVPSDYFYGCMTLDCGAIMETCCHNKFHKYAESHAAQCVLAEEKWKECLLSVSHKRWYVATDSEGRNVTVEFILNTTER